MSAPFPRFALEPHVADAVRQSPLRIVITGAGGWIGISAVHLLKAALGDDFGGRVHCFGSSKRALRLADGTVVEQSALADMASLDPRPTLVLHLAFLTKDRAEAMGDDDYAVACRAVDSAVIAALDRIGANALFVASSGAAYRAGDAAAAPAMRLYGALKLEQEERFADWAGSAGARAVIARIFNLSGPYINKQRSYALSAFILDALGGGPIEIHADRPVVRGYVAVRELLSLALAMLLDGSRSVARFDSGGAPLEMQQIAEAVAAVTGTSKIRRAAIEDAPADRYCGDDQAYRDLLSRYRIEAVPFPQQIAETVDFLSLFQSP